MPKEDNTHVTTTGTERDLEATYVGLVFIDRDMPRLLFLW